ncbi:hypothetical protein AB9K41_01515, partial [Cribrihabitans sp. XS_ASV171]
MSFLARLVLMILLTALVAAGMAHAGYARAAHELALAGSQSLVICGASGQAETIVLDRQGAPVETDRQLCAHCADCTSTAAFDLPAHPGIAPPEARLD